MEFSVADRTITPNQSADASETAVPYGKRFLRSIRKYNAVIDAAQISTTSKSCMLLSSVILSV